jgi:hypothetical protein
MTRGNKVDQELQHLLKHRRISVDEQRLETMREELNRRGPRRERQRTPGFFPRHRFSLSLGSALVLIGLIVWRFVPMPQEATDRFADSRFLEIVQDEERVDQALVLLGGFASASSDRDTLVRWDVYDGSMLIGYYSEGENVLEALYGSI